MSLRFNFNLINQKDLRKFLTRKMETERWEFSSAYDAVFAHYIYQPSLVSYSFPNNKSIKLIIKKLLKSFNNECVLDSFTFTDSDIPSIAEDNKDFFKNSEFLVLRNYSGKNEILVKSVEKLKEVLEENKPAKTSNSRYLVEKSKNKLFSFQGNVFDIRVHFLVVRVGLKFMTFYYPSVFINFDTINIDKKGFLESLGIEDPSYIDNEHVLMKKIFNLVQNTALIVANYLRVTNRVFRLENEVNIKNKELDFFKSELQYNLYAMDILMDEHQNIFLSDIIYNPIFGVNDKNQRIGKEKSGMYLDIIDNFVLSYVKNKRFNYNASDFVLLDAEQKNSRCKLFVCKKFFDETDNIKFDESLESVESGLENSNFISKLGEQHVENIILENKDSLVNDNKELINKLGLKLANTCNFLDTEDTRNEIDTPIQNKRLKNTRKFIEDQLIEIEQAKHEDSYCEFNGNQKQIISKLVNIPKRETIYKYLGKAKNNIIPILALLYALKKTVSYGTEKNNLEVVEIKEDNIVNVKNKKKNNNKKVEKSKLDIHFDELTKSSEFTNVIDLSKEVNLLQ